MYVAVMGDRGHNRGMELTLELNREDDGRWICEVAELPGVMTYGDTREEAILAAKALVAMTVAARGDSGFWSGFLDAFDAFGARARARRMPASRNAMDRAWGQVGAALHGAVARFSNEAAK